MPTKDRNDSALSPEMFLPSKGINFHVRVNVIIVTVPRSKCIAKPERGNKNPFYYHLPLIAERLSFCAINMDRSSDSVVGAVNSFHFWTARPYCRLNETHQHLEKRRKNSTRQLINCCFGLHKGSYV